mgnify:FL=1
MSHAQGAEAPDWADLAESDADGRMFHDDGVGYYEAWTRWRTPDYSPTPVAIARLERTDTHRHRAHGIDVEQGEPVGTLSLAATPLDIIYANTPADARALALAAEALAEAMERHGVGSDGHA